MDQNCHVEPVNRTATPEEQRVTQSVFLAVWGLGCPNCAARVRNGLISLRGVVSAYVDHTLGMAKVTFNPELVTVPLLIEAVARAGGDGRHEYRAALVGE